MEQRQVGCRLPKDFGAASAAFARRGARSAPVPISPSPEAQKLGRPDGLPTDPVTVRWVKVKLDTGETAILVTSRLDEATYPTPGFQRL